MLAIASEPERDPAAGVTPLRQAYEAAAERLWELTNEFRDAAATPRDPRRLGPAFARMHAQEYVVAELSVHLYGWRTRPYQGRREGGIAA